MKKEIKEKWVADLRSGKFKQGQGKLRSIDNKYCCLGVLINITNPKDWREDAESACYVNQDSACFVPYLLLSAEDQTILCQKNDAGNDFNEIADWIEKNIPEGVM